MTDSLQFDDIFIENMGHLDKGRMKFADATIQFKNENMGKLMTINSADIEKVVFQRLGNKPGLKIKTKDSERYRFGGFRDADVEALKIYISNHWKVETDEDDLVVKGWNYGDCKVDGTLIEFSLDGKPVFDVPLSNVSNCIANKSEATLEFHQNDENATSLMEMRFHMPSNPDDEDFDPVEEFRKQVLQFAGIETETGQPLASLSQILCATPRGRYDIKIFPNHVSLHGKTYDYKIPIKTIMRLFLVPNKDGRHVFFVLSLNPPIRQGQTRYHYLVLEFLKDEDIELELGLTEEQLEEQYKDKLQKNMSGPLYEIVSKIFRALVQMKITVPSSFVGSSGTPVIVCAHKQSSGFLYPLEKGFLYIPKPPMYIRFEEVASVHFARSDVSTRSFDFEIELKGGQVLLFNSVEKDEYNKLYDFAQNKHLRIRNAKRLEKNYAEDIFAGSDDELDPYKEAVKAEGKERVAESESDSEDDDYDLDDDLAKRKKERLENSSEGSASEPSEEYTSEGEVDSSGTGESEPDDEEAPKKKKKKEKEPKERKERKPKEGGKKKREKDPNAPKRGQSAYFIWFLENRKSIKKEGDSVADTAKRAGEMWKTISEDKKKPYEERSVVDKERYETEMKEYKKNGPPPTTSSDTKKEKKERSEKKKTPKKASGPSPSKAKSKEYISDSDSDSDDDKPLRPPPKKEKKEKKEKPKPKEDSDSD